MKVVLFALIGMALAVGAGAQTQTNQVQEPSVTSSVLDGVLFQTGGDGKGLVTMIEGLRRDSDPQPIVDRLNALASLQNRTHWAYQPAVETLITACNTALDLYTLLQQETAAMRDAVSRYAGALDVLQGRPPANAVEAAAVRALQQQALAAQAYYQRVEALRAEALRDCQTAAELKVSGDQTVNLQPAPVP